MHKLNIYKVLHSYVQIVQYIYNFQRIEREREREGPSKRILLKLTNQNCKKFRSKLMHDTANDD